MYRFPCGSVVSPEFLASPGGDDVNRIKNRELRTSDFVRCWEIGKARMLNIFSLSYFRMVHIVPTISPLSCVNLETIFTA